jgi:putative salt-induced outer membrane protein
VAAAGPLAAPAPAAGPRRIRGKSEFSYVSTGGTAETQTIGTSGELTFTPPHWRIETRAAYLRNHVDDQLRARRLTGQFRAARALGDRAELFGRATYLRNTFAGIDNSWDAAAGITAILLQSDPQRLSVDSGFGYLTEDRTQGLGRDLASVDFGLRYIREFSKRNRFTNDTALKADIERTSDWRLTHVAAIQAGLNSMLSLKFSHELNYRNEPVPGFTRSDTVASAAVVATF